MPGVADQVRRTQLRQGKEERKKEMEEILTMVREGRLHEADERQMEALSLALQLNKNAGATIDPNTIQDAVSNAIRQALQNLPVSLPPTGAPSEDEASRPQMTHVSLSDIEQTGPTVAISNPDRMGQTATGEGNSASKLEMLKKIKGNG